MSDSPSRATSAAEASIDSAAWQALREQLAEERGRRYWRSLEEAANSEAFADRIRDEFPQDAPLWEEATSRRGFLQLMGASLALAGINACSKPPAEKIYPFVEQPEDLIPGKPRFFATTMSLGGYGTGLLVENHMGRPTKIEGNALHPASLGATSALAQASILDLYDPDRSQVVRNAGRISTWKSFLRALQPQLQAQRARQGAGLRLLTPPISSPTTLALIEELRQEFPALHWHAYEAASDGQARDGARLAFGRDLQVRHDLSKARRILALDSNFLSDGPEHIPLSRQFAANRAPDREMNRLYVVEAAATVTGAAADHHHVLRQAEIVDFIYALAGELGVMPSSTSTLELELQTFVRAVADDLRQHARQSVILIGNGQPAELHALVHRLNEALEAFGNTIEFTEPVVAEAESLAALAEACEAGQVDALFILDGNPVYDAPVDLQFREKLDRVAFRVHLGAFEDESSQYCHWHLPQAHYLESWGECRAFDGTVSFQQPLIAPLYDGKTLIELLATLLGRGEPSAYEELRAHWRRQRGAEGFEAFWRRALHDGVVADSRLEALRVSVDSAPGKPVRSAALPRGLEVVFRAAPAIHDGRFANNAWLQELPDPLTKVCWDNPACIAPVTAERLGLSNGDRVRLQHGDRELDLPVWIQPGQAPDTLVLYLGYGRTHSGRVGTNTGFDVGRLRGQESMWFLSDIELEKLGDKAELACTQVHHAMEGRDLVRSGTVAEYEEHPDFAHAHDHPVHSLYPDWEYPDNKWGMVVDLNTCIGCNACMIACQSENNVPVVGKEQVQIGREMHWIRLDRYYEGELDRPEVHYQPVMCQHCEQAPCEPVCPVGATVHDSEGLNTMVYNRCVGTRYCSNNCPYKVRRFNFLEYNDLESETLKMQRNPDVTVRSRGVMEKCTYCVQRINHARIEAKKQRREIRDGEVVTACQSACPSQAIVFGNLNDASSQVASVWDDPRQYSLLNELGTKPRTRYLARIRNPNPALEEA